jgi:putative oxidoreductase
MQARALRDAWGLWIIRVLVGLVFLAHGSVRVIDAIHDPRIPGFSGALAQHGWVPGLFWAWAVTLVEFLGGLGLILGVATRIAALGILIEMVVAGIMSNLPRGFFWTRGGVEVPLVYAVLAAVLVLTAPRLPRSAAATAEREQVPA